MAGAAFFDLDRTVLARGSGPAFSAALRANGIGPDREIPFMNALYQLFDAVGENRPSMVLARQGARVAKGIAVADMKQAAKAAVPELVDLVQPFVPGLLEQHRAEGRTLVLATTTPRVLVKPLAKKLGFDDVVATTYGTAGSGKGATFDGTIDGHFTWGRGKLLAVREWAERNGIRLRDSIAYSDSWYDAPLLDAVGTGVAVNPDARLAVLARLRGWEVRHLDKPRGVAKILGREIQELMRPFSRNEFIPFADFDVEGLEHIPARGPALVVANHRSYFDATSLAYVIQRSGRTARFLGKKEVFDAPVLGDIAAAMGGIRVDRGTGSDEPLEAAIAALNAGDIIALMPQGTIPRGPAFFDPELQGRYGAARLWQATKVPVIPVGMWGTEKVWPRSARLPNVTNVVDPPEIRIRVGPPVELSGRSLKKQTAAIMAAIAGQLPDEARRPYDPTPEELALTYPPGYDGDPDAEADRRPGTDT